jgi:hypothetical protein
MTENFLTRIFGNSEFDEILRAQQIRKNLK